MGFLRPFCRWHPYGLSLDYTVENEDGDAYSSLDNLADPAPSIEEIVVVKQFIERLGEKFNIRKIALDRWGTVQMVQNLDGMGFTVVLFGQSFKDMSTPTRGLMKLVLEEKIAHGGHPRPPLDDGQHLHPHRLGREHQAGQGKVHRKDRRCGRHHHSARPGDPLRQRCLRFGL